MHAYNRRVKHGMLHCNKSAFNCSKEAGFVWLLNDRFINNPALANNVDRVKSREMLLVEVWRLTQQS